MFDNRVNPILDTDSYKASHFLQYPPGTAGLFAYLESRGGRYGGTIFYGLQPILKRLCEDTVTMLDVEEARDFFAAHGEPFPYDGWKYIAEELHGKLPLRIRAVPEGRFVPCRNVLMTVESTDVRVPWLVTWFETQLMRVWYPTTVATKSHYCARTILQYLKLSADSPMTELPFKLHDFGGRGVSSQESAGIGGSAHLVNFKGTDTVTGALYAARHYGGQEGLGGEKVAGYSIPAMEHSTVTSWGRDGEAAAFVNMIEMHEMHRGKEFPVLACVSDSYDIDNAVEKIWGEELLDLVLETGKTIVIRPDSGEASTTTLRLLAILERKVGMHVNTKGYRVLPSYYRLIWGDGNRDEADLGRVLSAITQAGYSASNIAFGMGGGLLQLVDRDTCSFAYKVSSIKIGDKPLMPWMDVKKEPKTDVHKVSKAGRLDLVILSDGKTRTIRLPDELNEVKQTDMVTVFLNGKMVTEHRFSDVRERAASALAGACL